MSGPVYYDRVRETTASTGTGTYTLAGAVTGFVAFSTWGDGNTGYYAITDGTDWEVGLGTYTLAGTTLARTTVLASSNGNAAVNWGAGSKSIWGDLPALFAQGLVNSASALSPVTNDGHALGTTALQWSDQFLASGAVINFSNGDVTITHSTNALAFAGASSGYSFDAVVAPAADDGAPLGSITKEWSDAFFASGGVLNWANGNATITHSSALLTANVTVASSGSSVGYTAFQAISTEAAAAAGPIIELYRNSASPAVSDILGQIIWYGQDNGPAKQEYASIQAVIADPVGGSEDSSLDIYTPVAGARTLIASFGPGVTGAVIATQAQQETATSVVNIVTPGRQQFHPSALKAWVSFNSAVTLEAAYNIGSVTDNGTGDWTVNTTTNFSSAEWVGIAFGGYKSGVDQILYNCIASQAAGTYRIGAVLRSTGAAADPSAPDRVFFMAAGDQ